MLPRNPLASPTPKDDPPFELDRKKLELDLRKQALEESFPRKWGAVFFGAMATISAAIITGGLGTVQGCSQRADRSAAERLQRDEKEAADVVAEQQRVMENDRLAVEMYFKYVDKAADTPAGKKRALLVGNLASGPVVKQFFGDAARGQISDIARSGGESSGPSAAVSGLPDLIQPKAPDHYQLSDFVIYVQYAPGGDGPAEAVRAALAGLIASVPAAQAIDPAKVPNRNVIRIYREDHRLLAQRLAKTLKSRFGADFAVSLVPLGRPLPNGVMEIWIGKADEAKFAAVQELPPGLLRKSVRSEMLPSGAGAEFSEWHKLCSDPLPVGYALKTDTFELEGDRRCDSWARCEVVSRTAAQVCWRFSMQGHNENPLSGGIRMSRGVLNYTALNPDAT